MSIPQQLSSFNYRVPGPLTWNAVQTANFTAVAGNSYPINTTSSAITVTLPQSPTSGDTVQFSDYAGTWQTNFVTIDVNGRKFNGLSTNVVVANSRETVALVYIDANQGWIAYSGFNAVTPGYVGSYLIVAGGGGGGINSAGGGGAGGLLTANYVFQGGATYTVVVGAGGTAISASGATQPNGNPGSNSTISVSGTFAPNTSVITAYGGGFGTGINAGSGGSGGGGGSNGGKGVYPGSTYISAARQGYDGGVGASDGATYAVGGGGGGAGAAGVSGVNAPTAPGGAGGAGVASSITGSSVTYAGGGGGSGDTRGSHAGGAGGSGGGGAGGNTTLNAVSGTANTGGGGGGGPYAASTVTAGGGGSGVVIFSVPTANYTGTVTGSPTVTTSGSNTIIKFTSSGSYTA